MFGIWCFDPLPVRGGEDGGLPFGFRLLRVGVEGLPVWLVLRLTHPWPIRGGEQDFNVDDFALMDAVHVSRIGVVSLKRPLKKAPGEGTEPTIQADIRRNPVGRVPSRGERDIFEQAAELTHNSVPVPAQVRRPGDETGQMQEHAA